MRALFILPNLAGGGAEGAMVRLADGFAERGHEATLLLLEDHRERDGPKLAATETLPGKGMGHSKGWIGRRLAARRLARWYARATTAREFDLVVSTLPFADEVVRLAGIPRVWFRIANNLSAEIKTLKSRNPRKARRRLARYAWMYGEQKLVAISNGVASDLRTALPTPAERITTIYNPFDVDQIRRAASAEAPKLPPAPYLLHAGRFVPAKRHDVLLRAFAGAGVPHTLVLLMSETPQLTQLIRHSMLADRVIVAGFQKNPFPWFAHATATIITSDREGFCNVIVESLICGTPVVSTDCPSGPSEILTGDMRRWLVPCGDADALAERLREVVAARPIIDPAVLRPFEKQTSLDAYEALADSG